MSTEISTSYSNIKSATHRRIKRSSVQILLDVVKAANLNLWGLKKGDNFVEKQVYLALYKYAYAAGYGALSSATKSWNKLSTRTLTRNTKVILKCLGKWGKKQIHLGNKAEWTEVMNKHRLPKLVNEAHLLLDSTDFRLAGKVSTSRKSESWSYKENSPAQRFSLVHDLDGKVRYIWGGYSPKTYDSDFVMIQKDFFDIKFRNATIVADCHYAKAAKELQSCKIITPFVTPSNSGKTKSTGKGIQKLTKKQVSYNKAVRCVRAKVEMPYGVMKNKFAALAKPFYEKPKYQNYLVLLAAAVYNMEV